MSLRTTSTAILGLGAVVIGLWFAQKASGLNGYFGGSHGDPNKAKMKEVKAEIGQKPATLETATFAAGCFWGVEATYRQTPGVWKTTVGYIGGKTSNPTYKDVCTDETGHAEAVQIEYDPTKVTYEQLLNIFWENHNPTTLNRQGPDVGTQYRSGVFYHSDEQKRIAEASKAALASSGKWNKPIVTEVTPAQTFYPAEDYHQQYLEKRGMSSCHM
jgi:peptide-methionine (S)-S-oxide reductase